MGGKGKRRDWRRECKIKILLGDGREKTKTARIEKKERCPKSAAHLAHSRLENLWLLPKVNRGSRDDIQNSKGDCDNNC